MDRCGQRLNNPNMPRNRSPAVPRLPAYALYGEDRASTLDDRLHLESIAERSRLHDWEIRPHRHETFLQLLLVWRGSVDAAIDGREAALRGPVLVVVPALAAHGFRFTDDVDGVVLTVDERHAAGLAGDDAGLADALGQPRWAALTPDDPAVARLAAHAEALRREWQGHAPGRALALDAWLRLLLVEMRRGLPDAVAPAHAGGGRALAHVQRFRALVDRRFREQPPLAALAGPLGITTTQLNRACRQVLGRSALGVLHARLLLEAQRELTYTSMSVKQIALGLGFVDAAYFTRFFQRHAGCTPTQWRARARRGTVLTSPGSDARTTG